MLTLTSVYALRAVVHLAAHAEVCPIPRSAMAHELRIPSKYLGHVLGALVRAGVVAASRGPGGGFRLAYAPKDIYLLNVISPFKVAVADRRRCPFANKRCRNEDPCPGHVSWERVRETFYAFFTNTSVDKVAFRRSQRSTRRSKRQR